MKKVALVLIVLVGLGIFGFLVLNPNSTKEIVPETIEIMWKEKESGSDLSEFTVVKEKPASGKYRFVKDYTISVCVKTAPGWEGVPYCVNNEYKDKVLFYEGDVVNSFRAFYDDQGTGWGIGLDGLIYGGKNMGIDMHYVEKVPDSTPEKYNPF